MRFTGRPHDEEKGADAEVLRSNQNLRPPVGMNIVESRLIDHADDRQRPLPWRSVPQPDLRAESIALWKEAPDDRGVNHGFGDAALAGFSERPAGKQPDAHDLDVVHAHANH